MKQVIVNIPDDFYKSFIELVKNIPGVSIEEAGSANVPGWHKSILEERIEAYKKDPGQGKDWDDFEKELDQV